MSDSRLAIHTWSVATNKQDFYLVNADGSDPINLTKHGKAGGGGLWVKR